MSGAVCSKCGFAVNEREVAICARTDCPGDETLKSFGYDASCRAMSEWQPIETAPRGGKLIWLYWPEGIIPDGWLDDEGWSEPITQCVGGWFDSWRGGNWVVPLIDAYFGVPSDPSCDLDFIEVDPTHWMPLPDPPPDAS